ncbi:MAG: S9 family peptidase [Lewinellaceae bacterium]|nr:S9 family peptidase [Lewinellaceae bacterium]
MTRIFLFLLVATTLSAQSNLLEQMLNAPFPTSLTAATQGEKLAWVYNTAGVRNVYVAIGPEFTARPVTQFTEDDGQDITNLVFSEDGNTLFFVRGGGPNGRGEIPNPTSDPAGARQEIWRITLSTDIQPVRLGEGSNPTPSPDNQKLAFTRRGQVWVLDLSSSGTLPRQYLTIRGNAGSLRWSPDGQHLALVSNRGDHAFIGVFTPANNAFRYLQPSLDKDSEPAWSPDSKKIAFLRVPNERGILPFVPRRTALPWSIWVADLASGEGSEVWRAPEGRGSAFREVSAENQLLWSHDGQLVFPWEGDGWTHLYSLSLAQGTTKCLTPGAFEVQYVSMSPDSKAILYSSNQDDIDRQHIWRVEVANGAPKLLTPGTGIEWGAVQTPGGKIAIMASGGRIPAHVSLLGTVNNRQPMGVNLSQFPTTQLTEPQAVVFPAADGLLIHGQLFLPPGMKAGEKRPAVLFFHGGSRRQMLLGFHHRGYYSNAYAFNQYLASQGYTVLSVNYRSGIGYGLDFREALNYGATGASEFQDVLGAGLFLRQRVDVDPARIGLWGGSYGGYLTALGLARASDLFAAGVDLHGVHDWNVVIKNFVPNYVPESKPEFARLAFQSSPMNFIDGWKSPVLIIHGDDDRNVPFSESVDLLESLRRQGVHTEQLIFPDEVHGFLLQRNWLAAYQASKDFFDRMLGNKK